MATFTGFKFQTLNMKKTNVGKRKKKKPHVLMQNIEFLVIMIIF